MVTSDRCLDINAAVDERVRSVFHPIEVDFPPTQTGDPGILATASARALPGVMPLKPDLAADHSR